MRFIMIFDKLNTTYEGCFWEIEHEGNKGYLLGSIHLASDHLLDPEGKIMEFFKRSQCLAFEFAPMWNEKEIRKIHLEEIEKLLIPFDQDSKARLRRNASIILNGIGCKMFLNDLADDQSHINESILQYINFIFFKYTEGGCRNGMESKLSNLSKERNLSIYNLENTEEMQREGVEKIFNDSLAELSKCEIANCEPTKLNTVIKMMEAYFKQKDEEINEHYQFMKEGFEKLGVLENWKTGNLEFFEIYNQRGVPHGFPQEQSYSQLISEQLERQSRNRVMAGKLLALIKDGKLPFAAIGARHTVGAGFLRNSGSVIQYLKEAGCKVTRISDAKDNNPQLIHIKKPKVFQNRRKPTKKTFKVLTSF